GTQYVELTNLGTAAANLQGLELWNRGTKVALTSGTVAPNGRAVVVFGDPGSLSMPSGVQVIKLAADPRAPFVGPGTALVLRANDGRWISTFEPYTSQQNLPEGVAIPNPGDAWQWLDFDRGALQALEVELLGNNTTPSAPVPTWQPRGLFSDW